MSFQVPYSSSPPSTPDRRSNNGNNGISFGPSNPSTTPAGPPPSSTGSFTPAGPPPASIFGSSMMDNSPLKPLSFSKQSTFGTNSPSASFMRSSVAPQRSGLSHQYDVHEEEEEELEGEYMEDEEHDDGQRKTREYAEDDPDAMYDDEGSYEDDENMDDYEAELPKRNNAPRYEDRDESELLLSTPGSLKRSRGMNDSFAQSMSRPRISPFEAIAKGLYTRMPAPAIEEADDVILETEAIVSRLYDDSIEVDEVDEMDQIRETLATIPGELITLWEEYSSKTTVPDSEEYTASIGPGPKATKFAKANFIAGLTLQIQHPEKISKGFDRKVKPLPQTLLEWMDEYHNPYPSQFEEIQSHNPSPANHRLFWDTIFNCLIRGKVVAVTSILTAAGWNYARNDTDEPRKPFAPTGFSGVALANIEKVVNTAIHVLHLCPAGNGDWNIRNSDWTLFRLRAASALEELKNFAEGRNRDSESLERSGMYSKTAQKAESKVPWHIYQNLVTMYNLVMGDVAAVTENAQDWLESTIGLLVWWDEGKDERRLGRSQNTYRAASRETDESAFRRKLQRSFEIATADSTDFAINSADEIEVALASLFEGDYVSVIGFLRGWSGPVSSAVAEVASLGGWLPRVEEKSLINMGSLDQDDMDLLGLNSSPSKADGVKDQTLIAYARGLARTGELRTSARSGQPQTVREGWEISIALLGRLDSTERSEEMVGTFLEDIDLDSSSTVDKLWTLLNNIALSRHAEMVAESYANSLAEGSHRYGEALWYYALAHRSQKVKDVLDLLISFSLIQSTAYPPESELDDHLRHLIAAPNTALSELAEMDDEAAKLLLKMLSGYATLRKFYDLRDAEVLQATNGKPRKGRIERKNEAAAALIVVIASSDDNIRGGLYDEGRGAVVSVDFLLALLGEAMVFINQPDFAITVSDIDILLKAVEDLQTVGPRVYSACTEFLQTVVASGQGLKGSSPTDMLRKSTSNVSGTSSFSLIGSSMLASQLKQSMSSSGVLVRGNIKRGWDWRNGISAGTSGDDLLRILRLGLAQSLAKAWLTEADGRM
ncbi:uncharacterized protein LY89DRAFT_706874 [Mollisia scopiformis]|uniref:Nuclear pore complex protein Nup85 n=1 Tax=Mollisia scopiformis TaxID=149040 RepID=A0A194XE16_MOLSC|nr:uncharacterized protein LY89DRAFT_706874 [Mollisia scopiformis]KUJ18394.1 hypothetical protein LY89DRAFT_706874 [Mollisia scopiformis]